MEHETDANARVRRATALAGIIDTAVRYKAPECVEVRCTTYVATTKIRTERQ